MGGDHGIASKIDPELRASVRRVPRPPIAGPLRRRLTRAVMEVASRRAGDVVGAVGGVELEVVNDESAHGVRVYTPLERRSPGALVWLHGGGLVLGTAAMDDRYCATVAKHVGIVVASVDYRLAPRHRFPAPLDDAAAAWTWLQQHAAERGIDPAHIAVGGASAGGGLAALLAQHLHDRGGIAPAAQWLFAPMLDDRTAADTSIDAVRHPVWDNRRSRVGWSLYLGCRPGGLIVPTAAVAARRVDLSSLPPAWIGVGSIDLMHDECVAYAGRLAEAGVPVDLDVVTGAAHGFETWAPDTSIADRFLDRSRRWLGAALSSADPVDAD